MRKIVLALAAVAAFGLALPVASAPAEARDVVIIKKHRHYDRGHHYGWYKQRHRHHHRAGATVIVR
jgi:hypothetical protein